MSAPCEHCRATIFWAIDRNGRAVSLNAMSSPSGNMVLRAPEGEEEDAESFDKPMLALVYCTLDKSEKRPDLDIERYQTHSITCLVRRRNRK